MSKTKFVSLMVDCFHVDYINIDTDKESIEVRSIVTLYETDVRSSQILRQIGLSESKYQQLDDITFVMNPDQFEIVGILNHGCDSEYDLAKPILNGKEKFSRILIRRKRQTPVEYIRQEKPVSMAAETQVP